MQTTLSCLTLVGQGSPLFWTPKERPSQNPVQVSIARQTGVSITRSKINQSFFSQPKFEAYWTAEAKATSLRSTSKFIKGSQRTGPNSELLFPFFPSKSIKVVNVLDQNVADEWYIHLLWIALSVLPSCSRKPCLFGQVVHVNREAWK